MKILARAIFIFALGLLAACATMSSTRSPGVDLGKIKTVYVIKLPADNRGINIVIAEQLKAMGYAATTGIETEIPDGVDATIAYEDRWMWDITMYMLKLDVELRDPKTGALLAEAESYRPSLQRASPQEMAKEVLQSIFTASK